MPCGPKTSRWLTVAVAVTLAGATGLEAQSAAPALRGATAPAPAPARAVVNVAEYRIGPEDVLDISVWRNEELTRTVVVRPDGRISVPLLNDLDAAGLTPMELRDVLARGYSQYVNEAEVSLIVREIHSLKVSVVGMVRLPGRYELRSQTTVLEALALAGGLSEFAKPDQILVYRQNDQVTQQLGFDYRSILNGAAHQNFVLRPGDIIVVP